MPDADPDAFVAFLQRRAGDSLRAVRLYSPDGHRSLYARQGVRERYSAESIDAIVAHARDELGEKTDGRWSFMPGPFEATVHVFDGAVLVNLPLHDEGGVLVSLDADAARQLHDFVHACTAWVTPGEEPPGSDLDVSE